uniref:Uncharacterized protein n=1 Tax=Arundo donax TaxID=35708 RepID=A0A0A9CGJ6_ARUDO
MSLLPHHPCIYCSFRRPKGLQLLRQLFHRYRCCLLDSLKFHLRHRSKHHHHFYLLQVIQDEIYFSVIII